MAVEEDELARHQNHTLAGIALKELIAVEEQLYQLARIRFCGSVSKLALGVEGYAGLSGVRYDEAHLRLFGQSHESLVLRIGVQSTRDNVDACERVHGSTVLLALQVHVIEAVLTVQPVHHAALYRLHNNN